MADFPNISAVGVELIGEGSREFSHLADKKRGKEKARVKDDAKSIGEVESSDDCKQEEDHLLDVKV